METKIYYGSVTHFDKGKLFGQITGNDGEEVFLHISEIIEGVTYPSKSQSVSYNKQQVEGKRPRAINVRCLN